MSLQTLKNQKGFTIVELLIVIVVIGILAAITIVAFNGVQNRGKTSRAQSMAGDLVKKAEAYNALESTYPADNTVFTAASSPDEVKTPAGVTVNAAGATTTLNAGNGQTTVEYCAVGTTGAKISYWDYSEDEPVTVNTGTATGTARTCS